MDYITYGLLSKRKPTTPDGAEVPTKLSELQEDTTHRTVTDEEKEAWNGKSDFDGNYESLTNKPLIPSKMSDLQNDSGYLTEHQDLSDYAMKSDIPTALKNPNALTIKLGDTTVTYDGSSAESIEISNASEVSF